MTTTIVRRALWHCGYLFLTVTSLEGWAHEPEERTADSQPVSHAIALSIDPVVDGNVLGDPAWRGAEAISGFWQVRPDAGAPATQRTEVFVGFTETSMHVAVVAYDNDPSAIFATDSRRDSSLDDTDAFLFVVDGLLDRQNGFVFGSNPAGVQFDGQVTKENAGAFGFGSGGFNQNWDAPWNVVTKVGEFG